MCSQLGGFLILLLGVLYIAFEKTLLVQASQTSKNVAADTADDGVSRLILGGQVGLVAVAMFVTRSSVASLQAKRGLPLGTQVVGWVTLGKQIFSPVSVCFILFSLARTHSYFASFWTGSH